jgi:hypothetical protein
MRRLAAVDIDSAPSPLLLAQQDALPEEDEALQGRGQRGRRAVSAI